MAVGVELDDLDELDDVVGKVDDVVGSVLDVGLFVVVVDVPFIISSKLTQHTTSLSPGHGHGYTHG